MQVEGRDQDDLDDKSVFLDDLCTENGAISVLVADPQRIWKARKSYTEAVRMESLIHSKEDLVVPVDKIAAVMHEIMGLSQKSGLPSRIVSHAGDGNIHLNFLAGDLPEEVWEAKITAVEQELYRIVYQLGGKLSGEHGIGAKRKKLMQEITPPAELAMMRAIKKALDPNLILNPGKIFDPE
jgi:glycolate oxidase